MREQTEAALAALEAVVSLDDRPETVPEGQGEEPVSGRQDVVLPDLTVASGAPASEPGTDALDREAVAWAD